MSEAPASVLAAIPAHFVDSAGRPNFGTFEGYFSKLDFRALQAPFQKSWMHRPFAKKKWVYLMVADRNVVVTAAVVDLTYASNAFCQVVDVERGETLVDESRLGLPLVSASVSDSPLNELAARFRVAGFSLHLKRLAGQAALHLSAHARTLRKKRFELEMTMSLEQLRPSVSVVAPIGPDGVNVTQKTVGLPVSGFFRLGSQMHLLKSAVGAFDYTQGFLQRHTSWRWAFGVGELSGQRFFAFNLVEGLNDEHENANNGASANENAVWLGNEVLPLGRANFQFQPQSLMAPWQVSTDCGRLTLHFEPRALHRERHNLVAVRSDFAQPVGLWRGQLRSPQGLVSFERMAGVAESQQVLW